MSTPKRNLTQSDKTSNERIFSTQLMRMRMATATSDTIRRTWSSVSLLSPETDALAIKSAPLLMTKHMDEATTSR